MTDSEIKYIPNDDFESASERDFEQVDIELYQAEDGRKVPSDEDEAAATFIQAIEESRLLTFEGEQFLFKRLNFLRFRAKALQMTLPTDRRPKKALKEIDRLLQEAAQTRESIARSNLRLVCSIARKISSQNPEEFDEYVGEANAILVNAIDKFDFARGYRFSTYATHAIQRHLYRYIGRASKRKTREWDSPDTVEAAPGRPKEEGPSQSEVREAADAVLARIDDVLDERERTIVLGRYGFTESGKTSTLRELAEQLGLSKERVRQLQVQALEKLAEVAQPFESTFAS